MQTQGVLQGPLVPFSTNPRTRPGKAPLALARKRTSWLTALLVTLWAALYLPHLRTSPGWYGDETLIHHTSRNLVAGQMTNMALWNTFWHPHYPYQPLYSFVNGLFAKFAGGDLWGSRAFNALLALAAALALLHAGRRSFGLGAAAFAACMFLGYSQSVIHFRMSYAHNAVGLGVLIWALFLLRRSCPRHDGRAGIGLAIAAGSHPLFIHAALAGWLCRLTKPRSWWRLLAPAGIVVAGSLGLAWLVFRGWLWEDLIHLKNTYLARAETDGAGGRGLLNFIVFIRQDAFHLGMVLGLLLCFPLKRYAAPVVGLLVLYLLVRNRQNLVPFYYHAVVILPTLCLGWAGLWRWLEKLARKRRFAPALARWPLATTAALLIATSLPPSLSGTWQPRNHYWVTQNPREVEAAARWLNAHTRRTDVVGGNPNIAWLLHAETSVYLQMITWYGLPTQGYENLNKPERFRFDASLENCRYAVVGDIDQRWALHEPNVPQIAEKLARWPLVWRGPNYLIFANPAKHLPRQPETLAPKSGEEAHSSDHGKDPDKAPRHP